LRGYINKGFVVCLVQLIQINTVIHTMGVFCMNV
jgi:hypothetical protein